MNLCSWANKRTLLLWSLLISSVLLCAQVVDLHIHDLDHKQDNYYSHAHDVSESGEQVHLSKVHFFQDVSHNDHHDILLSIADINLNGLFKNNTNNVVAAVFILFYTLMILSSSRSLVRRRQERKPIVHRYYALSPPLRAPPQY